MRKLKSILYLKGMTQTELADKIGVTEATVSRWVNDKNKPEVKQLRAICSLLNVEIKDLLDLEE